MSAYSYKPDPRGLAEIATSPGLQAAVLAAARRGQAFCESADPEGRYSVEAERVTAGFRNEVRAGAILSDDGPRALEREDERHTLNRAVNVIEANN